MEVKIEWAFHLLPTQNQNPLHIVCSSTKAVASQALAKCMQYAQDTNPHYTSSKASPTFHV